MIATGSKIGIASFKHVLEGNAVAYFWIGRLNRINQMLNQIPVFGRCLDDCIVTTEQNTYHILEPYPRNISSHNDSHFVHVFAWGIQLIGIDCRM